WMREQVNGTEVPSRAWSAIATLVLTGEDAAPLAFILPRRPLDLAAGHFGAIQLVFGAGNVTIGSNAFPVLANPQTAASAMTVVGAGISWYPLRGVALLLSYGHQMFDAAAGATKRPDEDTMIARFQVNL